MAGWPSCAPSRATAWRSIRSASNSSEAHPRELSMRSVRLRITGRVQMVGYRAWTVETARRLGLRGWARNRPTGSVEALVTGDDDAVPAMIEACREGPFSARVRDVARSDDAHDGSG